MISGTKQARVPGENGLEWTDGHAGDYVQIGSGQARALRNISGEPAIELIVTSPRLGEWFEEAGRPFGGIAGPPSPVTEHPNVARIKDGYAALANGDFAVLNNLLAEDVVWHFGGRNQLSGDYRGRDAVYGFLGRLMELTEGTLRNDIHTVLADDEHAVALVIGSASRGGRTNTDEKVAHVYHLRDGKITEFWYAPTDQYAADELLR